MADRPGLFEMLGQTWPARLAKSAWEAAKLPGDVYAGRVDPLSDEGIGRSADLAGMVMGGTYAGAPKGAMGAGAVKPIRAYHGSPHDFDRFDLSKIGTGEGAQAYGHGLYFAGNPKVAESYKLAGPEASRQMDVINGELTRLAREMDKYPRQTYNKFVDPAGDALKAKYDQLLDERTKLGRMYEVDIKADPAQFLDWDKALNMQGPEVTAALQKSMRPRQWQEFSPAKAGTAMKQGFIGLDEQIASEKLRDAGLPGIKYLDQGSRGAKEGTSNYVLFRDDIIDIVKKYGLAGAAAMYGISQDEAKAAMEQPKTTIGRQSYGDEE